ncbi:MAG: hypothetical protein U1G08_07070 [Verrucomicrobiota bacterium]
MNPLTRRLQDLRDKAARFQQVVETVPERTARLRTAIEATTGELERLKLEFHGISELLKSDTETSLAESLSELEAGMGLLARAGYEWTGVDLEPGSVGRILVHLDRVPGAGTDPLESLLREAAGRRRLEAVLRAMIHAERLEPEVRLSEMSYRGLSVYLGPVPAIRIRWGRAVPGADTAEKVVAVQPGVPVPASAPLAGFAADAFFGKNDVVQPGGPTGAVPATALGVPEAVSARAVPGTKAPAVPERRSLSADWRKDALARFKKMPDLS